MKNQGKATGKPLPSAHSQIIKANPGWYVVKRNPDGNFDDFEIVAWKITGALVEPIVLSSQALESTYVIRRADGAFEAPHINRGGINLAQALNSVGLNNRVDGGHAGAPPERQKLHN